MTKINNVQQELLNVRSRKKEKRWLNAFRYAYAFAVAFM